MFRNIGEQNRLAVKFARKPLRTIKRAVSNNNMFDALLYQMARYQFDSFTCTNQERSVLFKVGEDLLREAHSSISH